MNAAQDFEFSDTDFARTRKLIRQFAGIALSDGKRALVYGRLVPRLRKQGLTHVSEYLEKVEGDGVEREHFINSLTTNVTDFFREKHHFEALRTRILPRLYARGGPVRIWSAGCSSGEEPYTIGLTVLAAPPPPGVDVKILAADLDSNVVAHAAAGIYPLSKLEPVSAEDRHRGFMRGRGKNEGFACATPELKALVHFRQLNLMAAWPMKGPFDVIFCRNVMIYFDEPTRRALIDRFVSLLAPGGVLMLGHSEAMIGVHPLLRSEGHTLFAKLEAMERAA
jgi:chemotaxis protein methyltransferase CheR